MLVIGTLLRAGRQRSPSFLLSRCPQSLIPCRFPTTAGMPEPPLFTLCLCTRGVVGGMNRRTSEVCRRDVGGLVVEPLDLRGDIRVADVATLRVRGETGET